MLRFIRYVDDLLVGLVGRPILWFVKFMGPAWLLLGIAFNEIAVIEQGTGREVSSRSTIAPFVVGLLLFSISRAMKRYDTIVKASQGE